MVNGTIFRADFVVKIHSNIMKASRNESHGQNEPGGGAGGALGCTEPFVESVGRAEGSQGDSIWVDCELSKPREKVEHGENRTAAEGVKHLAKRGGSQFEESRGPCSVFGSSL